MKTELTNELKEKFFALYWGQNVLMTPRIVWTGGSSPEPSHEEWVEDKLDSSNFDKIIECNYPLWLKSLSSISDDDAIEVGKILSLDGRNSGYIINLVKAYLGNHFHGSLDVSGDYYFLHIIDLLRSRGYALPFMGISVEQMIKAGWIKLTE